MTQQAREGGRTQGASDLAGAPEEKREARAGTQTLRGDRWKAGDPGAIFFQRIF